MSGFNTAGGGGVQLSDATPLIEAGLGSPGVSTLASRADHVHPAYGGGGGGGCAGYAASGKVELATLTETLGGSSIGSSGCFLSTVPANIKVREELATDALFANFAFGVNVTAGFGTRAVDLQAGRFAAGRIASGGNSTAIGYSNQASGADGVSIGAGNIAGGGARVIALGSGNYAISDNSMALGQLNRVQASGTEGMALGYRNYAGYNRFGNISHNMQAIGRSNFAFEHSSVAIGIMNNVYLPGNLNNTTGVISGDPQSGFHNGRGINSSAIGVGNRSNGDRSLAVGFKNESRADAAVSVGVLNFVTAGYSVLFGYANNATFGDRLTLLGYKNIGQNSRGTAVGYGNSVDGNDSVAVGRSNFTAAYTSVALGVMNNVATPSNLHNNTGVIAGDPQAAGSIGVNSSAVGVGNTASGLRSSAIGFKSSSSATGSVALGDRAVARISETVNISGGIITRKDNGEGIGDAELFFAGTEVIYMTPVINLTAIADYTISVPTGARFWWDECGIILTDLTGALTTQPTVRFGITGTPAKYVAAVVTTLLTAALNRERFQTLLADVGEASLLFGVTSGAVVATSMAGRAFFRGRLIEDE